MRRQYHSPELRSEAVRQVVEYRQPIKDVAEQLHLPRDTVRVWVRRHREGRSVTAVDPLAGLARRFRTPEQKLLRRMIEKHLLEQAG